MGSQSKKKKRTKDTRSITSEIKRAQDLDQNKLALQPTFELGYSPVGINVIDFVNVTATIGPSQTVGSPPPDTVPPAQVTGLSATAVSDTQLIVNWTANTEPDLNHYNIYRGTVSGFTVTPGVTSPTSTPSTNSYPDTGRTASTTYYYKVLAVDNSNNLGTISAQAQGTTLAPGAILPSWELHLDGSFADTSPFNLTPTGNNTNNFVSPGKFGTGGWRCNTPTLPASLPNQLSNETGASNLAMDTTSVGFSWSFWIYPTNIGSTGTTYRTLVEKLEDAGTGDNQYTIQMDSAGTVYFFVKKGGTDYKRQIAGFVTNSWQHIGATFNASTNTIAIYRNGVAGASSVATPEYRHSSQISLDWLTIGQSVGYQVTGDPMQNGTYYEGYFDEIRYYKSTVLTSTQINNLFATNAP